jgi:hypothetical protein
LKFDPSRAMAGSQPPKGRACSAERGSIGNEFVGLEENNMLVRRISALLLLSNVDGHSAAAQGDPAKQSPEELQRFVSPIALYPDVLVAQMQSYCFFDPVLEMAECQ